MQGAYSEGLRSGLTISRMATAEKSVQPRELFRAKLGSG
jgi:hypothetical protein